MHGKRITLTQSGRNPFIFSPGTLRPRVTLRVIRGWSCRQPLRLLPPPPNHRLRTLCAPLVVLPHSLTSSVYTALRETSFSFYVSPRENRRRRSPNFLSNSNSIDRSVSRYRVFDFYFREASMEEVSPRFQKREKAEFPVEFYDIRIMARSNAMFRDNLGVSRNKRGWDENVFCPRDWPHVLHGSKSPSTAVF